MLAAVQSFVCSNLQQSEMILGMAIGETDFWVCFQATLERVGQRGNASDMEAQPFYRWIRDTYNWHVVASYAALFALGGLPALVWGGALRAVWVYHVTWFVNSASHCWGTQPYNSGELHEDRAANWLNLKARNHYTPWVGFRYGMGLEGEGGGGEGGQFEALI